MAFIISAIFAYLLGSISCAVLVAKWFNLPDPRTQGSGNPGATNMLRVGGKKAAIIVLVGDAFKGLLAVLIGRLLGAEGFWLGMVGLIAVVGHIYPVFFKFKGGKGVATAAGVLFGLSFIVAIVTLITWVVVAAVSRYSSLASLLSAGLAPIYLLIGGHFAYFIPMVLVTVLIAWKHSANIERLRSGVENKLNF